MAANVITNQQPARIPFRVAARQHVTPVGTVDFAAGRKLASLALPPVGWMGRLFISIRGQIVAGATAPTFKNVVEQAWNLLSRIQINGNGGLANVVDYSGFDAYLYSHFLERGFKMDAPGVGSSANDYMLVNGTSPAANATINNFAITYVVPLSANNGMGFETGLVNVQARDSVFNLDLTTSPLADIWNNAPAINNARVEVYYLWYEMPDPMRVDLPMPQIVRLWSEEKAAINGLNNVTVQRGGTLMQAIIAIKTDGVYDSKEVESLEVKLNVNSSVYQEANWVRRLINRYQLGVDLPEGVTAYDFYHSTQSVSEGDSRDMFDLDQYSQFDIIAKLIAGAVTDASTSKIRTIYRTLHDLQG